MNVRTCALVAVEQLPATTAHAPDTGGNALAALDGAMPTLAGSPIVNKPFTDDEILAACREALADKCVSSACGS